MKNPRLYLFFAISWFIISTILLTLPGSKFPKEDWLSKIWFDKWVHIGLFAILTWLWCMASRSKTRTFFYLIAASCLVYGIAMEFVQGNLIPNRSFDTGDIVADVIGCWLGAWFSWRRYIKK